MEPMSSPTADVSVRIGWPEDAEQIAAAQAAAWRVEYAGVLPVDDLAVDTLAGSWRNSLARATDARNRILVALDRANVRGFVLTMPSPDPDADPIADGELTELTVHPDHQRVGHGSRLLQAAIDTLGADHFTTARVWVASTDDVRRVFLTAAGFAPDGAHRELDLHGDGTVLVKQVRLHVGL